LNFLRRSFGASFGAIDFLTANLRHFPVPMFFSDPRSRENTDENQRRFRRSGKALPFLQAEKEHTYTLLVSSAKPRIHFGAGQQGGVNGRRFSESLSSTIHRIQGA
jgi:hypothetical protein